MSGASKPPYRVPSLAEIRAIIPNGFTVASTFSGCGGSSLGYAMAGFKVVAASEFVEAARETYAVNFPTTPILPEDIRKITGLDLLRVAGLKVGELDILDGSPPCVSFSMAGKREAGWGKEKGYSDTEQRSDDLFFEFARILDDIKPRVFVAENVEGLLRGKAKGYQKNILAKLRSHGYRVACGLIDASSFGVPQIRKRAIFIGVREDLNRDPAFPKPFGYRYSVAEAIPWLGDRRYVPTDPECSMTRHATGREWKKVKIGGASKKYFQLKRPNPSLPVLTITASGGNPGLASVAHPYECRKFDIAELKRLCSFPDDFELTGTYAQRYERLGRAVPPLLMREIAKAILTEILE